MHLVIHISLCLATAAVYDDDVDDNEGDDDCDDGSHTDSLAINDSRFLYEFFLVKGLKALIGWVSEASADCIENAKRLNLTAISLLINYYRGVNIGAIILPVGNFIIYVGIVNLTLSPSALFGTSEAIFDALLGLVPIDTSVFMGPSGAILINHRVAL